jgi:asparagine synthase (glutamine-hydrolysing)
MNEAVAVERVREALTDAVRSQLVSDVPLGAFLSGGLDSSSVVALMRAATDGPIRTCSMTFAEAKYDESQYSQSMADAVGAEHYARTITASDVEQNLDRILWAMDQPTVDAVNTYFVSQTAREAGLTVALSGLGGDEVFGGYESIFRGVPRLRRTVENIQRVPGGAALVGAALAASPRGQRWAKAQDMLRRPPTAASAYLARRGLFSPSEVQRLVAPEVWEEAARRFEPLSYITQHSSVDGPSSTFESRPFAWLTRTELATYTHHQLLRDTDAMSMAHSLEVRVPLLDTRLIELAVRIPDALQVAHGSKWLLRAAVADRLPQQVSAPRPKQGFTLPFDLWLAGPLRERLLEMLAESARTTPLRSGAVMDVWNAYQAGRAHWSRPWALAVLANSH